MCFCYEGVVCFVDGIYNLSIEFCIGVVEKLYEGLSEISFSLRRFKQRLEVIQAIYMTNASKRGDYLRQSKLCISFNELRKWVPYKASALYFQLFYLLYLFTHLESRLEILSGVFFISTSKVRRLRIFRCFIKN